VVDRDAEIIDDQRELLGAAGLREVRRDDSVATPLMRAKSEAKVSSLSRERPVNTKLQPRCAS